LIKYFEVVLKAGTERDIKALLDIMIKIKEDFAFSFNNDVVSV